MNLSLSTFRFKHLNGFNNEDMIDIYIKTLLDLIFILLAIVAYSRMFQKFVRSHRRTIRMQDNQESTRQPKTSWQLFRRSRFVVAVFLITCFFLCVSLPDLVLSIMVFKGLHIPDILFKVFLFLSAASDTIDCLVYVFLRADVRKLLCDMLKFNCISGRDGVSAATFSVERRRRGT